MHILTLYININHIEETLIQFQTIFAHVDIPNDIFKSKFKN
jgi:hypothetical protein